MFSVRSYEFSVEVLLNSLAGEGIGRYSINMNKIVSFFHNLTEIHNSYKSSIKKDGSVHSLRNLSKWFSLQCLAGHAESAKYYSKLKNSPRGINLNHLKLGIVYKYRFCGEIRCSDRTYLIVNLQRRFREWRKNKQYQ